MLVTLLMKHKELFLKAAGVDVINAFQGGPIDDECVYDFDVDKCVQPIENPADVKKPPKTDDQTPVEIYFDCETYPTAYGKHLPYLVCYEVADGSKRWFEGRDCLLSMLRNLANVYGGKSKKIQKTKTVRTQHDLRWVVPNETQFKPEGAGEKQQICKYEW